MKEHFRRWKSGTLIVPRWFLTLKYAAFVALGLVALLFGVPTINFLTPQGYALIWASLLVMSSAVGAVTSFREDWETPEKWAAFVVSVLMVSWGIFSMIRALVDGDPGRLSGAWVVLIVSGLPTIRTLGLMRGTSPHAS